MLASAKNMLSLFNSVDILFIWHFEWSTVSPCRYKAVTIFCFLRQESGARIKIEDPRAGENDRVVTIFGSQDEIHSAQVLIQKEM